MPGSRAQRKKKFESVFTREHNPEHPRWRIHGSGVHGYPDSAKWTSEILGVLGSSSIAVKQYTYGSPVNVDSHHLSAKFLDGGLYAETGNYWYSERGAWIGGAKAVLFVALKLGLAVPEEFRREFNLERTTLDDLEKQLHSQDQGRQ